MRNLLLFVLTCCLVIMAVPVLCAQEAPPPAPTMQGSSSTSNAQEIMLPAPCLISSLHVINSNAVPMLSTQLNLTDEQKTKVTELFSEADKTLKPTIQAQQKAVDKYTKLLLDNSTSESDLTSAAADAMKMESAIVTEKIKTLEGLRALLTDDQKAKLNTMFAQFAAISKMRTIIKPRLMQPGGQPGTSTAAPANQQ
ncbi:Spy/CpxP family protein refolding chaperone [bacterium]|nr:Spy/CpxP family protein refolding chaperone [bacterium]